MRCILYNTKTGQRCKGRVSKRMWPARICRHHDMATALLASGVNPTHADALARAKWETNAEAHRIIARVKQR